MPYMNDVRNPYAPYQNYGPGPGISTINPNYYNQTNMPQAMQQTSANSGNMMTIFVNSEAEVNNYPVAAGLTVLLISFDLKRFWLKSTDTSGVPKPLRTFTFDENPQPMNVNQNGSSVTRQEFDALSNKLNKLLTELGGDKNE